MENDLTKTFGEIFNNDHKALRSQLVEVQNYQSDRTESLEWFKNLRFLDISGLPSLERKDSCGTRGTCFTTYDENGNLHVQNHRRQVLTIPIIQGYDDLFCDEADRSSSEDDGRYQEEMSEENETEDDHVHEDDDEADDDSEDDDPEDDGPDSWPGDEDPGTDDEIEASFRYLAVSWKRTDRYEYAPLGCGWRESFDYYIKRPESGQEPYKSEFPNRYMERVIQVAQYHGITKLWIDTDCIY